jgi:Mg-chelatase subunit ChlD
LLLEATRLRDNEIARRLPGVLHALNGPAVPPSDDPETSLRLALSRRPLPAAPSQWGIIRPSRLWNAAPAGDAPTPPTAAAALTSREQPDAHEEPEEQRLFDKMFDAPGFENGMLSRILRQVFQGRSATGRGRPNGASAAEFSQSTGFRTGSLTTHLVLPASVESAPSGLVAATTVGCYPEWDAAKNRYLANWCRVVEMPPTASPATDRPAPVDVRFCRPLARIGLRRHPRRREPSGQDLDLDAIIRYQIDLASGTDPGDRIWLHHALERRDLAVLLLLDTSGSSAEGDDHTVLNHHVAMASAMVESLHRLGARVAALSFEGRGRRLVRVRHLKRFHEHGTGQFRSRVHGVEAGGFTRLGTAIRHAAAVLSAQGGSTNQLLIVVSDGFPYDDGYEGRYAIEDTARAISDAQRAGIGCLCLSFSEETSAAFKSATAATFRNLHDVEVRLTELFHSALNSADRRRRYARVTRP